MSQTIAVIEDDPDTRKIYTDVLEARGYRVLAAVHGAEGVTLVRRHRPDLVIMDVRMPVMDGWHALRYLKADQRTASIPVWAVSAYLEEETASPPIGERFDRTFPKPFDPARLLAEVEDFLGPAGARSFRRPD